MPHMHLGIKGNTGLDGYKGDKGDTGDKGVKGDQGNKGGKGDPGYVSWTGCMLCHGHSLLYFFVFRTHPMPSCLTSQMTSLQLPRLLMRLLKNCPPTPVRLSPAWRRLALRCDEL